VFRFLLDIDYDIEEVDNKEINKRIDSIKNRINFLENTFTYQWYISDERNKIMILLKFIENKLK
jgi:hypothetical protein